MQGARLNARNEKHLNKKHENIVAISRNKKSLYSTGSE
jgi:hypothetical protein